MIGAASVVGAAFIGAIAWFATPAKKPWFNLGRVTRAKAEDILRDLPVGSFLVRLSESHPGSTAISYKTQTGVCRTRDSMLLTP